ncbi:N-acetylglucosamine-6-phosphate deacetylase [Holdemania massiliensis]|uniref:N-acetylglucosamine-6-phosphate deacetylase n=1 Tax=Holdemania massiliensis TaxID=1468449 RepID=UPI001F06BE85|nr:amidohydrolase family protein [Holdemania massiliensis]MCH1942290.1 amidohydrolase family protein [Holdemania massiliensis]
MKKQVCRWIEGNQEWDKSVEWNQGKIISVEPTTKQPDFIAMPALIDLHTHGFRGWSSEESAEDLRRLALAYAERGIGGFCATLGPRPLSYYLEVIHEYRKAFSTPYPGARFLGLHLEGPYLNPEKAGAIDPDTMLKIDLPKLESFLIQSAGIVKIMTIAPELPNALPAIRLLKQYGVIASAGHTAASYEQCETAVSFGLTQVTHTFNAMESLHHRNPGLITSALINPKLDCEMISDGYHLQLPIMKLLTQTKGTEHILCVSDSGQDSGFAYPEGTVLSDGCVLHGGAMVQPNGVIAGSTCDLSDALKMFVLKLGISLPEAARMLSLNAAQKLCLKDWGSTRIGSSIAWSLYNRDLEFVETLMDEQLCLLK